MSSRRPAEPFDFPIVAVCASSGGLAAFQEFFSGLTQGKRAGMAFVLVQHLDPVHKSLLTELVKGFTTLDVFEVTQDL